MALRKLTPARRLEQTRLADETWLSDRAVRGHVYGLRAYFTIEDRPGRTWRLTIPPPLIAVVQPRQKLPNPPAEIADVPCKVPKTTTHTTRARVSCETHGREWFEADGRDCFECAKERLTAAKAKRETPRGPRVGLPTYSDRPARPDRAPMTAERVAEIEAELVGDGWRKREGQWKKR